MRTLAPASRAAFAAATLAGGLALAHADEAIETDRPDFVESSAVVGAGRFQIETGLSLARARAGGVTTRTLTTPTLLRLGVGQTLELRLEGDGLTRERVSDPATGATLRTRGFADLSLGLKWHVQDGTEDQPGIAWLAHVDTASGSKSVRGSGLRPSLRAAVEWDLPADYSVGVMPGLFVDRDDAGRRYAGAILAATLGKAWSPRWHSFVELAGQRLARKTHGGSVLTLDTGLSFTATAALQFDVELARGLSDAAPVLEGGVGAAYKF